MPVISNDWQLNVFFGLVQAGIFWKCWKFGRKGQVIELSRLGERFKQDVVDQARRGEGPDWVRYMDEADRVQEAMFDKMRTWAMSALVVGIGGTMVVLVMKLGDMPNESGVVSEFIRRSLPAILSLIESIGDALQVSLYGVANNLAISWLCFPRLNRRFDEALDDYRNCLQQCSGENSPQRMFSEIVRDELGKAFKDAVRKFPEAFSQLDKSVESLGEIISTQSEAVLNAARELRDGAQTLTGASTRIVPAAQMLQSSTDQLRDMPIQLGHMFEKVVSAWWKSEVQSDLKQFTTEMGSVLDRQSALGRQILESVEKWEGHRSAAVKEQQQLWERTIDQVQAQQEVWKRRIEEVQRSAAEINTTVQRVPTDFSEQIGKMAGRLGIEFGSRAEQHVVDLINVISGDDDTSLRRMLESMSEQMHSRFLDSAKEIVMDTREDVNRQVEEVLIDPLNAIREGLTEALNELPGKAQNFAESLSTVDEKLRSVIDLMDESARQLKSVSRLSDGFEKSLTVALQNVATLSIERLERQVRVYIARMEGVQRLNEEALEKSRLGRSSELGSVSRLIDRVSQWFRWR